MIIKYTTIDRQRWQCHAIDRIQIEIEGFQEADLPELHRVLSMTVRPWFIARQLFGLMPIIPPVDYDLPSLAVLSAEDITEDLGLKRGGLKAELDAIRGLWFGSRPKQSELKKADAADKAERAAKFSGEFHLASEDPAKVITAAGFHLSMFQVVNRSEPETKAEMAWFVSRIGEFEKPLANPMAKGLAQGILVKEMLIRRKRDHICTFEPKSMGKQTQDASADLRADETAYQAMLVQLDKVAPWMGLVGNRIGFHGVVADLIRALQEAEVNGDHAFVDGMFTATEVQVLLRTSKQEPRSQYRPDIVALVNAAKGHLWDRNWESSIPASQWKRLRTAWVKAEEEVRQSLQERLVDLTDDGSSGEYDSIQAAPPLPAP